MSGKGPKKGTSPPSELKKQLEEKLGQEDSDDDGFDDKAAAMKEVRDKGYGAQVDKFYNQTTGVLKSQDVGKRDSVFSTDQWEKIQQYRTSVLGLEVFDLVKTLQNSDLIKRLAGAIPLEYLEIFERIIAANQLDPEKTFLTWTWMLCCTKIVGEGTLDQVLPAPKITGGVVDISLGAYEIKRKRLTFGMLSRLLATVAGANVLNLLAAFSDQVPYGQYEIGLLNEERHIYCNAAEHSLDVENKDLVAAFLRNRSRYTIDQVSRLPPAKKVNAFIGMTKAAKVLSARGSRVNYMAIFREVAENYGEASSGISIDQMVAVLEENSDKLKIDRSVFKNLKKEVANDTQNTEAVSNVNKGILRTQQPTGPADPPLSVKVKATKATVSSAPVATSGMGGDLGETIAM